MAKDVTTLFVTRSATQNDHEAILKVAKLSKYTKDFSNTVMFSSPAAYAKGWIRVATIEDRVVGFTCRRDKSRAPEAMLYFIGVNPDFGNRGIGGALLIDMMEKSLHKLLTLNCMKENASGCAFYRQYGFKITGEAMGGTAHRFEKRFD